MALVTLLVVPLMSALWELSIRRFVAPTSTAICCAVAVRISRALPLECAALQMIPRPRKPAFADFFGGVLPISGNGAPDTDNSVDCDHPINASLTLVQPLRSRARATDENA